MNDANIPVIVVCGAMGVGKSTIAKILIARKSDQYIILKGDLCNVMTFPEVISECRRTWVDVCLDIPGKDLLFFINHRRICSSAHSSRLFVLLGQSISVPYLLFELCGCGTRLLFEHLVEMGL